MLKKKASVLDNHDTPALQDTLRLVQSVVQGKMGKPSKGEDFFTLSQLERKTGLKKADILYLAKKHILEPLEEKTGKTSRKLFTVKDLESAIYAKELKNFGYKPSEAAILINILKDNISYNMGIVTQSGSRGPSGHYDNLDQTERAQMLLVSRFLAVEEAIICGRNDKLGNSVVLVRRVPVDYAKEHRLVELAERKDVRDLLLTDNSDELVKGISTPHGETFSAFPNNQFFLDSLNERNFVRIVLTNELTNECYEVILGMIPEEDISIEKIKKNINTQIESYQFLLCSIRFMFETVRRLNKIVYTRGGHLNLSILNVLADAMTHIPGTKWDCCCILQQKKASLNIVAASSDLADATFEQPLRIGPTDPIRTLPEWVFKNREMAAIDWGSSDIDDQKSPFDRLRGAVSAAAVPALAGGEIQGVIYLANRNIKDVKKDHFSHSNLKLLKIFGHMIGEVLVRQHYANDFLVDSLKVVPETALKIENEQHLKGQLKNIIIEIAQQSDRISFSNESLIGLTIRISGIQELNARRPELATWVSEKVEEKTARFVQARFRAESLGGENTLLHQVELGQYVVVLKAAGARHIALRTELEAKLRPLLEFEAESNNIGIHVWTLEFTYPEISQRLKATDPALLSRELFTKFEGALRVLPNISRGDALMKDGKFAQALVEYEMAEFNDRENPYVIRHLARCLIRLKRYPEAIKYGILATKLDKDYSSSHKVLADALSRHGEYSRAEGSYKKAIELNHRHPSPYVQYGKALVLQGTKDSIQKALEQYTVAMNCDPEKNRSKYLALKAEACARIGDYESALKFLENATAFSPSDDGLRWRLLLTEIQAKQMSTGK